MNQKIIDYVNEAFKDAPDNTLVGFAKKGFISSITRKYENLISKGYSEEEAFNIAISQCPEITGVAADLSGKKAKSHDDKNENNDTVFYHSSDSKNEKTYRNETNEEKEQEKNSKRIMGNFCGVFWPIIVASYFLCSFLIGGAWKYSWIIFIVGAAIQVVVSFALSKTPASKKAAAQSALWLFTVVGYLGLSFYTRRWEITWTIFLFAIAITRLIDIVFKKKNGK